MDASSAQPEGLWKSLDDIINSSRNTKNKQSGGPSGGNRTKGADKLLSMSLDEIVETGHKRRGGRRGRAPGGRGAGAQWKPDGDPRPHMSAFVRDDGSGDVVVRFRRTDLVVINPQGDVKLSRNSYTNTITLKAMQTALKPLGMTVTEINRETGEWSVTDGRSLVRFTDGVTVPAKGRGAGRGQAVLSAFNDPNALAAQAATAASNAAAAALGISVSPPAPRGHGRGANAANAAAAAWGRGGVGRGRGGAALPVWWAAAPAAAAASGGPDLVRRQRAKGRYHPY